MDVETNRRAGADLLSGDELAFVEDAASQIITMALLFDITDGVAAQEFMLALPAGCWLLRSHWGRREMMRRVKVKRKKLK